MLLVDDDCDRSLAGLATSDVLLVNPVRDGLNLVAKEGPLLNRNEGVLVLSREAGAWEELSLAGRGAIGVNPFDVAATADALHQALVDGRRRARRARRRPADQRHRPHLGRLVGRPARGGRPPGLITCGRACSTTGRRVGQSASGAAGGAGIPRVASTGRPRPGRPATVRSAASATAAGLSSSTAATRTAPTG